jgi:hypothetical protein
MSWHLFDEERGQEMATALARAAISTDWGGRTLSSESPLYDPLHYNNGTVWPFVTGFLALAEYRYHNPYAGHAQLDAVGRTFYLWGLGRNPEVFSGSSFEPLETAVPQQFFATSMYLTPLLRGAFGIEADAPRATLTISPHLFDRPGEYAVRGVRIGSCVLDVRMRIDDSAFVAEVRRVAGPPTALTLHFDPALAPGARVRDVRSQAGPVSYRTVQTGRDLHVIADVRLDAGEAELTVRHTPGWRLVEHEAEVERGDRSRRLKVLDARLDGDALRVSLEGRAGWSYELEIHKPNGLVGNETVSFAGAVGDPQDGYARAAVRFSQR